MAQVTLYRPHNMQAAHTFYGYVQEANAARIVITNGAAATVYEGSFVYSGAGDLSGGTLTAITSLTYGAPDYVVTGLSVPATVAADLINRDDIQTLQSIALAGADLIQGSAGSDILLGYAGNDTMLGGAGYDLLVGGAGDDLLVGGIGNDALEGGDGLDTAWTGALRRQATLSNPILYGTLTYGTLAGPEGTDSLSSIEAVRFADGTAYFGAGTAGAAVHRLYLATLGRAADAPGLGAWAAALEAGALSIKAAADGFTGSAEFAQRYGAPDAGGFVALLYGNVLGRAPDAAGLSYWTGALGGGAIARSDVVLGFSESAEFKAKTAAVLANGLWAPDPAALDVLRTYLTTLDRLPDAGGLANWTTAHKGGLATRDMEASFIGSVEFGAKYGATTNAGFVDLLYRNVFDRAADAGGLAFWAGALDAGRIARSEVVHGLAFSDEMTAKITPFVSDGIAFV